MVKFITKQAADMLPPTITPSQHAGDSQHAAAAPVLSAGAGDGVTYQELVLDGERVVLEVSENMAGPDGVIRLLQYVASDGTVQYVATGQHDEVDEAEYAVSAGHAYAQYVHEPSADVTMTSLSESTNQHCVVMETHSPAHIVENGHEDSAVVQSSETGVVGDDNDDKDRSDDVATHHQSQEQPMTVQHRQRSDPVCQQNLSSASALQSSTVRAVDEQASASSPVLAAETAAEDDAAMEALVGCDEVGNCYVCGQPPAIGTAVWTLLDARTHHSGAAVAEMLADVLDRELTITSDDVVCAGCLAVVNQCDMKDHPLYESSAAYLSNLFSFGLGEKSSRLMPVIGPFTLRRGPGRPRKSLINGPAVISDVSTLSADSAALSDCNISVGDDALITVPSGATLCTRATVLSGLKQLPAGEAAVMPAADQLIKRPLVSATGISQQLLIVPGAAATVAPKRKYTRKKRLQRPGRMYSRYQMSQTVEEARFDAITADQHSASPPLTDGAVIAVKAGEDSAARAVHSLLRHNGSDVDEPHEAGCSCASCLEHVQHRPSAGDECLCGGCVEMRACRQLISSGVYCYRCRHCQLFDTDNGAQFRRHWRACHRQSNNSEIVDEPVFPQRQHKISHRAYGKRRGRPAEPQKCSTCGEQFDSLLRLKEHCSATGHDKRLPCPFCRRLYHPEILKTHKLSHTGAFHCKLCNVFFCSKETLLYHMNRHSGAKPFKCMECDKGFRSPSTLFMHHRRNHTQEKPYRCNHCPKRFAARMELEFHTRQHTGVRPFACNVCDKTYASRGSLTKHLLTHSQQRPFACSQCDKRFFSRTTYRAHMNVHNNVRPYACEFCGKTFYSQNKMSRHRKLNCRQARMNGDGFSDGSVSDMVLTVEVEPDCEVRVTSVDEPLADGVVVLAENRPASSAFCRRPWTASRRAASLYGRLQEPFCLVSSAEDTADQPAEIEGSTVVDHQQTAD